MTFFFDARFIRVDHHDGISRFAANLCSELVKLRDVTAIVCDPEQLKWLPVGIKYILESAPTSIREIGLARRLNKLGATLVYSPMQTTGALGKKFKLVLTLHDLIYYRHRKPPREFNLAVRMLWRLYHLTFWPGRLLLRSADGLVTISQVTAQLIRSNRLYSGPTEIVYNAPEKQPGNLQQRSVPASKSLVYMGSFMPYKDVDTLVRAMEYLPDYQLELLSRVSESEKHRLLSLAGSAAEQLVFRNGVTDAEYFDALQRCTALVTASRDEGFGIPLVEAMQVGTPVICTDLEIFREVAGDSALYFEAGDAVALSKAVRSLESSWKHHSDLSLKTSAKYSWRESAVTLNEFLQRFD